MNIVVTGSLGHIGKPLAEELADKGHTVTVISSKQEKQNDIEMLGAKAAIGSLEDVDFLTATFSGADAVFAMVPPNYGVPDMRPFYQRIGHNYVQAIGQAGVKRVVYLSSYGADLNEGTGLILGAHDVEGMLNDLPNVAVTCLRPTYFYYNLYAFVDMIRGTGIIRANYGGDDKLALVAPVDIAAVAAEELLTSDASHAVRYIGSDECTGHEIAQTLGAAIGKPDLKWEVISDEQMQSGMESNGMPTQLVRNFVDMFASLHKGALSQDYFLNRPSVLGNVKLADFAKEFAAVYNA